MYEIPVARRGRIETLHSLLSAYPSAIPVARRGRIETNNIDEKGKHDGSPSQDGEE